MPARRGSVGRSLAPATSVAESLTTFGDRTKPEPLRAARPVPRRLMRTLGAMPIYEYVCMKCESHFEELVRHGEQPDCPECGTADVRKQLSVFAAHGSSTQAGFDPTPRAGGGGCCGGSCGCG